MCVQNTNSAPHLLAVRKQLTVEMRVAFICTVSQQQQYYIVWKWKVNMVTLSQNCHEIN